ncbi:MAG: DUF2330 domain-containing protein [Planctomycetes bacterium]|nr:DUF2330 domain-containing protein [Planctomycetota bacterium]
MKRGIWLAVPLAVPLAIALAFLLQLAFPARACCPAPPPGRTVINADQTIVILWDAAAKTEHFIRRASFKSEADDFGFLIPSPTQPELNESGNDAFPFFVTLTEPEVKRVAHFSGFGCFAQKGALPAAAKDDVCAAPVRVLEEKLVAGFKAAVLEADSAKALVDWLKENGYAFSPEIEAWAKPYVEQSWKITALKVAKGTDRKESKDVGAAALRMSFKTDRPLFPYREPDSKDAGEKLNRYGRMLRIFFLAEARYNGALTKTGGWETNVPWSDKLKPEDRKKALELLKLPESTGPAEFWLTEFEHNWPYRVAPADVYFSPTVDQSTVRRPPVISC